MTETLAYDRLVRILALAAGAGALLFFALAAGTVVAQADSMAAAFYVPGTVAFYVLPVVLAVASRFAGVRALRIIAGAHAVAAALVVAFWMPAMTSRSLPYDSAPWPLNSLAVAAITGALAFPPRVAWPFLAGLCVGGGVLRHLALGGGDTSIPIQDFVSMLSFCTIVAALIVVTLRAGRDQDTAARIAREEAGIAAESWSRAEQRVRFGSFVHDHVITTLLAAAQNHAGSKTVIRESALNAVSRLDEFVSATADSRAVPAPVLAELLRSALPGSNVEFRGDFDRFRSPVPYRVVDAMTGAVNESLRNSLRYAADQGADVARTIELRSTATGISVSVVDDGRGFDPSAVPPERLGIRISVVARMAVVAGGSAAVTSAPGLGTTVLVEWREVGA